MEEARPKADNFVTFGFSAHAVAEAGGAIFFFETLGVITRRSVSHLLKGRVIVATNTAQSPRWNHR